MPVGTVVILNKNRRISVSHPPVNFELKQAKLASDFSGGESTCTRGCMARFRLIRRESDLLSNRLRRGILCPPEAVARTLKAQFLHVKSNAIKNKPFSA
jgi:hypothetical protein